MVDCHAYRYTNRFNERIFHSLSLLLQVNFRYVAEFRYVACDSFLFHILAIQKYVKK